MLVFAVAAVKSGPDWAEVGKGFIPHIAQNNTTLYLYFVIGLLGAAMTPYEVYFYSSGGVEEEWGPKDIGMNRANAIVGYGLGGTLSIALMIIGATVFLGHGRRFRSLGPEPGRCLSRCASAANRDVARRGRRFRAAESKQHTTPAARGRVGHRGC